jgi:hypothetical protein
MDASIDDIETVLKHMKDDVNEVTHEISLKVNSKAESREIDRLASLIMKKPDLESVKEM